MPMGKPGGKQKMDFCSVNRQLRLVAFLSLAVVIAWPAGVVRAGDRGGTLPSFSAVKELVLREFDKFPDHQPADIISRGQVEPVFRQLAGLGWQVADWREILEAVPADGDFLVKQLRTPGGRKFMRGIAKYPDAYDRLDRLGRLPYGKNTIRALIRGPGGYKLIEYMTTASGGRELGRQLSNAPKGKNFNDPTGRIYTAKLLLARLKESYTAASRPRSC